MQGQAPVAQASMRVFQPSSSSYLQGLCMLRTKRMTKDNSQIYCISVIIAMFSMWLMWLCTWLHQWHPVIM